MAHYLSQQPSPGAAKETDESRVGNGKLNSSLGDLRVFWGPEFCRLEYLLYLVSTGRIKDRYGAIDLS